jgi:hypothetical protein
MKKICLFLLLCIGFIGIYGCTGENVETTDTVLIAEETPPADSIVNDDDIPEISIDSWDGSFEVDAIYIHKYLVFNDLLEDRGAFFVFGVLVKIEDYTAFSYKYTFSVLQSNSEIQNVIQIVILKEEDVPLIEMGTQYVLHLVSFESTGLFCLSQQQASIFPLIEGKFTVPSVLINSIDENASYSQDEFFDLIF